ncbi:MAG: Veg family protein [Christensenellales bacterium]|jgi:uncharacterized protein Veg
MREINQDIDATKRQVTDLKGITIRLRVNRGRNRIETIHGSVESTYPSIFTVRHLDGDLSSFSYNDILAKNILFYRAKS